MPPNLALQNLAKKYNISEQAVKSRVYRRGFKGDLNDEAKLEPLLIASLGGSKGKVRAPRAGKKYILQGKRAPDWFCRLAIAVYPTITRGYGRAKLLSVLTKSIPLAEVWQDEARALQTLESLQVTIPKRFKRTNGADTNQLTPLPLTPTTHPVETITAEPTVGGRPVKLFMGDLQLVLRLLEEMEREIAKEYRANERSRVEVPLSLANTALGYLRRLLK